MQTEQLTGHDVFELLRPDQIRTISETAEEMEVQSGDMIFRRGESADDFFIVLEGQVALRFPARDGLSLLIDELGRGAIFGSCVCFQIDRYTLNAQCTEKSRLLRMRAATLKKLLDEDPALGYAVQTVISRAYFRRYIETAQKLQAVLLTMPVEPVEV
jgi:CRP-like cAMP-binding protein